jgi:hypothetical protein
VEAVSPAAFRRTAKQVQDRGPWRVHSEVERRGQEALAVQLVSENGEQSRLTLHRTDDGRLDGATALLAQPCAPAPPPETALAPPLAAQLDWIKQKPLASADGLSDDEIAGHFAPSFLSAVPRDKIRADLAKISTLGPYTFRHYEGPATPVSLVLRVGVRTAEEARLSLAVEPQAPHRITTFSVLTQPPCQR